MQLRIMNSILKIAHIALWIKFDTTKRIPQAYVSVDNEILAHSCRSGTKGEF